MTVSQKVSVSLLITVILFAAFSVVAFTGLFDMVEARFYNPSITEAQGREVLEDAEILGRYFAELEDRFVALLDEGAIRRSFLPNQSAEDIFERSRLFGLLAEEVGGLQSARFIDSAGRRIHFSTLRSDVLRQDRLSVAYKNYGDDPADLPFRQVAVEERAPLRLVADTDGERLLFALPFSDSFEVHKGTALFSLSLRGVAERLVRDGRLRLGEDLGLISTPPGLVTGLPRTDNRSIVDAVASIWKDGVLGPTVLKNEETQTSYALISERIDTLGFFVGRLAPEALYTFPQAMKFILLASFFLTSYLAIFLLFNLRQDSVIVIKDRLKRLQISLMEEYYERKGDLDWSRWSQELEQRKIDVRSELKRGLRKKPRKNVERNIDDLIDKSWDDLVLVLGGRREPTVTAQIDEGRLQDILGRVLAAGVDLRTSAEATLPKTTVLEPVKLPSPEPIPANILEEPEELEELEDLEGEDETGALESLEPEVLEEVQELEAAEFTPGQPETKVETGTLEEAELLEELEVVKGISNAPEVWEKADLAELEEIEELEGLVEVSDQDLVEVFKAPAQKEPSNIRLVFGEDDIPVIVESSGIELVDEDIESVISSLAMNDETLLEELESVEGELIGSSELGEGNIFTVQNEKLLNDVAREIEFSLPPEQPTKETNEKEYVVASPFDTILAEFSVPAEAAPPQTMAEAAPPQTMAEAAPDAGPQGVRGDQVSTGADDNELAELEEFGPLADQIFVQYPFGYQGTEEPRDLEFLGEAGDEGPLELLEMDEEPSIEVKDGVPFVADTVYDTQSAVEDKSQDIQDLVNSVIGVAK